MSETITPYIPDLEKIARESEDPKPKVLSEAEYDDFLTKTKLRTGEQSDKGILMLMEHGLIKIGGDGFDLMKQISGSNLDFHGGNDFWVYSRHAFSELPYDITPEDMVAKKIIDYDYVPDGGQFIYHQGKVVLSYTREWISLSNVVMARLDGKSREARRGRRVHGTAPTFHPGFHGQMMLESTNDNELALPTPVPSLEATMTFSLLATPSTRPRNLMTGQDWTHRSQGPYGYWAPEWTEKKERILKSARSNNGSYIR